MGEWYASMHPFSTCPHSVSISHIPHLNNKENNKVSYNSFPPFGSAAGGTATVVNSQGRAKKYFLKKRSSDHVI